MNSKAAVNESDKKMNRWRKEILLFTWPVSLTRIGSLLQMLLEARFSSMHFSLLLAPMQILAPMYCTFLIHFSLSPLMHCAMSWRSKWGQAQWQHYTYTTPYTS